MVDIEAEECREGREAEEGGGGGGVEVRLESSGAAATERDGERRERAEERALERRQCGEPRERLGPWRAASGDGSLKQEEVAEAAADAPELTAGGDDEQVRRVRRGARGNAELEPADRHAHRQL